MKRLALAAALLALGACTTKSDTPAADTTAATMAPAPATTTTADTGMKMGADTSMKMMDSSMKKDSMATPAKKP